MGYNLIASGSQRQHFPRAHILLRRLRMLVGYYQHSIDGKGRVKVPQTLREIGGGEGLWSQFYLAPGPDGCVFVYSPSRWQEITSALFRHSVLPTTKVRNFQRQFASRGAACKCDAQGRLVVPERLIKHAQLKLGGTIVWVGADDRIELWDKDRWDRIEAETHASFDDVFEHMADLCGAAWPMETDNESQSTGGGAWVPENK